MVGFDRRRKKFAEEFGRDPSEVDARPEEPGDNELPVLKGLADKVDELCPPEEGDMGARDVYDMLQGTMSDRHVHSGPGAVSRYIEGVEPVRFIDEPSPLIPPEDMLAMAFGALGQLYEEICHDVGLSPTDVATCER